MDPKTRKKVLRLLSNGMYVVTARNGEEHAGATITWLTQSSFRPPLLVAGVRADSALHGCLAPGGTALVQVLGSDQEHIAQAFFRTAEVDDDAVPPTLNGLPYEETEAGALLQDVRAWAACRVRDRIDCGGDHHLVVLEVVDVGARGDVEPLTVRDSPWEYGG